MEWSSIQLRKIIFEEQRNNGFINEERLDVNTGLEYLSFLDIYEFEEIKRANNFNI